MTKDQLKALYREIGGASWFEDDKLFQAYKRGEVPGKAKATPVKTVPAKSAKVAVKEAAYKAVPVDRPVHQVKDGPPLGVMLAKKWTGSDPTGWLMSEKLDGHRAYWTGKHLYTRTGNRINAPSWFMRALPEGIPLDGELWAGRGKFQQVSSYVRKDKPLDSEWRHIQYLVFDAPSAPGGCEARFKVLNEIVKQMCAVYGPGCPMVALEQKVCRSESDMRQLLAKIEAMSGEGVMLRKPGSKYSWKRTSDLLKVKSFMDEDAKIIGYQAGEGKHKGRLGAYRCKLLKTGVTFEAGTGMSDKERDRPLPIGTVIKVRFQKYSDEGVPVTAVFLGERE